MEKLAEKRRQEAVAAKAQEARDTQAIIEQEKAATVVAQKEAEKAREGQKSSLPDQEKEMETEEEEGSADPQTTLKQLKCQCPSEWTGPHKKVKAYKLFIDLITLTEGDLHGIGDTSPSRPSKTSWRSIKLCWGPSECRFRSCRCALLRLVLF